MNITPEMMAEDEKRWHARDVITELSYCGNYMCDRKNMTNLDIRFYAYLMRKAHDMLKEQDPRVMTLDEVLNAEDFVWAEIWTPGDRRWCLIYARINKSIYDDILMLHEDSGFGWTRLVSNYNMKGGWRCWSALPTEEQRKNTPWEGENNG